MKAAGEGWDCPVCAERERCAKVAERELRGHKPAGYDLWPDVPAAIRAIDLLPVGSDRGPEYLRQRREHPNE